MITGLLGLHGSLVSIGFLYIVVHFLLLGSDILWFTHVRWVLRTSGSLDFFGFLDITGSLPMLGFSVMGWFTFF
jgi:hypothetical protein